MTIDDIRALIASDESRTLELKKTAGELKDGAFVYVTFKRPAKVVPATQKEQSGGNVAQNVAQNLDERIVQIIKSNPSIKREDIANQLSVTKKTVERHLKNLGIKWEGHSKTGHWVKTL